MAVTIREIAEHAGVSRQTVSAILGEKASLYRPETRKSVMASVEALGYRLNPAARAVGRGRFGAIGVLMSTVGRRSVLSQSIDGIQQGVSVANLAVRFCHVSDDDLSSEAYLRQLPGQLAVDGLLVNYTYRFPGALGDILDKFRIPSVWMNVKQDHDCVHPDDAGAGAIAVEYLAGLGHQRIGYATRCFDELSHYSVQDRHDGYVTAMLDARLTPNGVIWPIEASTRETFERLAAWLNGPDRPTAVFTHSNSEAIVIYAVAMGLGLRVPGDLSLMTIVPQSEGTMGVDMDTVRLPSNDVGRRAVELLRQKVRQPQRRLPTEAMPMALGKPADLGLTCAPPDEP